MKKFLITFIISTIVLGIVIGQCNGDSDSSNDDDEVVFLDTEYVDERSSIEFDESNKSEVNEEERSEAYYSEKEVYTINDSVGLVLVPSSLPNQLLVRTAYLASYNNSTKCPNWVSWHLTAEHVDGEIARDRSFYEDYDVPAPRATNEDYRRSGWSRGHMCPAGDNKWDEKVMQESNLLTNICPQNQQLNSGVWNVIERDCRKWAKKYGEIYIVCGPVMLEREHETIGENKVVVPEAFFKVILRVNPKPAAIGFVIRNNEGKKKRDQFVNTVDDVERITGYDFFPALPDDIENVVEATARIEDWR